MPACSPQTSKRPSPKRDVVTTTAGGPRRRHHARRVRPCRGSGERDPPTSGTTVPFSFRCALARVLFLLSGDPINCVLSPILPMQPLLRPAGKKRNDSHSHPAEDVRMIRNRIANIGREILHARRFAMVWIAIELANSKPRPLRTTSLSCRRNPARQRSAYARASPPHVFQRNTTAPLQ